MRIDSGSAQRPEKVKAICMKANSVRAVFKAFTDADVRFLVVGGLAVNVYGLLRMTVDIDVVVQLLPENVNQAFKALESIGYHPTVPVSVEDFANAEIRESWIQERGMRVLRFWSDSHWETPVDLFVSEPFAFDEEYDRATVRPLEGIGRVRVVSLPTLMRMKQDAGRPQDLADLDSLRLRMEHHDE